MRPSKNIAIKILPTLLCLMAMFIVACSGTTTNPTTGISKPSKAPASQQVFVDPEIGVSDIATFDPGQATDLNSISAIDMVFTGMVQLNDQFKVKPQMASSWDTSSDGLTWTFHLKPNLKFSDGTPLTSQDVIYSIDRALSPQVSAHSGASLTYLGLIKDSDKRVAGKIPTLINDSLLAPDPNTVVLKLSKQTAYFLEALTYPTAFVVEKRVIDKWGLNFTDHLADNGGQGGDGPFKVQRYAHNQQIVFVPNPNYYGAQPQLQKVVFPFYKDDNTAYQVYQSGRIDETSIPTTDLKQAETQTSQFHKVPQLWINYYAMNYLVKPFDNIKIRQAFDLALNKDAISQAIWKGKYVQSNHIVPQGMPGYFPGLKGPDGTQNTSGNPTLAKQLFTQGLQEEGMALAQFPSIKFTYASGSRDIDNEVTTAIGMWQNVLGVSIKPDPIDFNRLLTEITGATNNPKGLAFWRTDWIADYPDPQDWLTLQFAKGAPDNNDNYGQNNSSDASTQQQVQQQLVTADSMTNPTARLQAYNHAEQQLINDVAWLPVNQVSVTYLLKPYVIGVVDNVQDPDDWANIYIASH